MYRGDLSGGENSAVGRTVRQQERQREQCGGKKARGEIAITRDA